MVDEERSTLLRFHQISRIAGGNDVFSSFRDAMRSNFAEMHKRFDRLDAINREISAALARIERKRARRRAQS